MNRLQFQVCLIFLLLACSFGVCARPGAGDVPPDALGVDASGAAVHVSALRGKVVAVAFWASWCGQCRQELPVLERFQRAAQEDLAVVAVNYRESPSTLRKMRRQLRDYAMTITHDRDGSVGESYGVKGLPHLLLIDRSGTIAHVHIGFNKDVSEGRLIEQLNMLLRESPPSADVQTIGLPL